MMTECDDIQGRMIRLEESKHFTDEQLASLLQRFIVHMDKEEEAFKQLYERIRGCEKEIQVAFKERDAAIHELDKKVVRILAWATAAFTVVTLAIQTVLELV